MARRVKNSLRESTNVWLATLHFSEEFSIPHTCAFSRHNNISLDVNLFSTTLLSLSLPVAPGLKCLPRLLRVADVRFPSPARSLSITELNAFAWKFHWHYE